MDDQLRKQTVLVVDDTPDNIDVLHGILREHYRVKIAMNGKKALAIATSDDPPDIILLDIMMPEMDGYEVCIKLKSDARTRWIPVIFVTAMNEDQDEQLGLEMGAVDYITKPVKPALVVARTRAQLALYNQQRELEFQVKERTKQLNDTRLEVIQRLGRAGEYKDNETGLHVIRMSHYSIILAKAAGFPDAEADILLNASPMHDIGKIGIPDAIILKPGKLNDKEWEIMRKHPAMGAAIIGKHEPGMLETARIIALTHHEKWDGSGYPRGVAGEEIPIEGRIVSIADVFDALTTARPYKDAWSVDDAVEVLEASAGSQFDPRLVPLFIKSLPEILKIKKKYAEGV